MIQVERQPAPPRRPSELPPDLIDDRPAASAFTKVDQDRDEPIYVSPPPVPWPRVFPSL